MGPTTELTGSFMAQAPPRLIGKSFETLGREVYGPSFSGDRVIEDMQKALATGDIAGFGDATALRLENLDSMMTSVLFTEAHLKLFNSIPRTPSAQPLFQWIRRDRYGNTRGAVGFREGGAPTGGTSKWTRKSIMNKYMGVRRGYTHQMLTTGMMGGAFVDPVTEETRNGTLELLEKIERGVLWGNHLIEDANGNEVHYDGIYKQLTDAAVGSVINLNGRPLDFEDLENAAERLVTTGRLLNFSRVRTFWKPRVLTDLAKLKVQSERRILGQDNVPGYRPGVPLLGYRTQHGEFPFDDSILMEAVDGSAPLGTGDTGAPVAPATCVGTPSTPGIATNMVAGTYYYFAASINDAGESAPVASSGVVVAANGDQVSVAIADAATATGYRLYRGITTVAADAGWIATVPEASGATYVDTNQIIPGAGVGLILNLAEEDIVIPQMAPLTKFPLAITSTTIEFLLILYHVLAIKAAERQIMFVNIGTRA
jgi:hypothetical protein